MLPPPTLSLTLPSLHDGTTLSVRVYHSWPLSPSPKAPTWHHHAAVVAHPYAPLGGSYDDTIVGLVAETLLRAGFLVVTFNFRGAHGSAGRTSWTAKAERADYMSVAGFACHYAHLLDPFSPAGGSAAGLAITPIRDEDDPAVPSPLFLFSGYSYGAMITTQLPPLATILGRFARPEAGSDAAEIRLRAQSLAASQNAILGAARCEAERERRGNLAESPRKSLSLRIGGDEDIVGRRRSHDSHRSPLRASFDDAEEKLRRGVQELLHKTRHHSPHGNASVQRAVSIGSPRRSLMVERRIASSSSPSRPRSRHEDVAAETERPKEEQGETRADEAVPTAAAAAAAPSEATKNLLPALPQPPNPQPAYLMISPPLSIAGNLTALSLSFPGLPQRTKSSAAATATASTNKPTTQPQTPTSAAAANAGNSTHKPVRARVVRVASTVLPAANDLDDADRKLVENTSLVIYGDSDLFVSNRRMRDWAARLQGIPGSRFRAHEVSAAGHFWHEKSATGEGSVADVLLHAVKAFAEGLVKNGASGRV